MEETNFKALDINLIAELDNEQEMVTPQISQPFLDSPWYPDIIYVLQNLQAPPRLSKTKSWFLKMKASKFFIMDNTLFWKNHEGILLNYLLKEESDKVLQEFHVGDCGRHLYWKSTTDKSLRAGFYWSTLFSNVKKFVTSCHKCQIFEGKRKLLPLPLKPISTKNLFNNGVLTSLEKSIHPLLLSINGYSLQLITLPN